MSGILNRSLQYLQSVAGEGSGPGWSVPSAQQRHSLPGALASWLHQVSVCLDREEEKLLVSRQLELLTVRLAGRRVSAGVVSDSMVRLLYIYLLGYDVSAALDHCVKLAGSSNILARKMGYLASSLMIPHSDKLLLLLTNSIIRDISSNNIVDVQLGLVAAANIVNSSMLDLVPLLVCRAAGLLSHRSHLVRSKSLILLDWLCQLEPSQWAQVCPAVIHCLEDVNPGVVIFAVQVLSLHLSDSDGHDKLVVSAVTELHQSLTDGSSKIPSDYHYKGHSVPHLHIYCVKIYRRVASSITSDRSVCDGVIPLLQSCLTSNLGCKDLIIQALVYEVVLTVSSIEGAHCLLPLCLRSLSGFLSSRHSSVVYCGLSGLEEILRLRSGGTTRDQEAAVLSCLGHPDTNIQRRAAQLILLLASRDNLVSIVDRVLAHVARARADYSAVLDRLVNIMEKYGDNADCDWKASTLLRIIQVSKNRQRDLMMERLKLLLSSDEAEGDAATVLELNRVRLKLRSLLADIVRSRLSAGKVVPVSVICLSVWCEAQLSAGEEVQAVVGRILESGRGERLPVPVLTHCLQALQTLAIRHGLNQLGGAALTYIEENTSHDNLNVRQTAEQCLALMEDSREEVSHQSTSSLDLSLTFLDSYVVKSLESAQATYYPRPSNQPVSTSQLMTSSYSVLQPSHSSPAAKETTSVVKSVWTDEGRLDPEKQEEEEEVEELQTSDSKNSLGEPLENNVSNLNDDWD